MSAKSPGINSMAREAALLLAPLGRELGAVHVSSKENCLADALSRLDSGVELTWLLQDIPRTTLAARDVTQWRVLGNEC
eukprot:841694-Amphidinium_carterae.1